MIKLDAHCRYLLANHMRPVRVGTNGITLRFGKQVFNYRDEQTGTLRGQEVLAWFDPELPEVLTVTDLNRQNPFSVARSQDVSAMSATKEELAQELSRIDAHMRPAKVLYRTIAARFKPQFRLNNPDGPTRDLGRAIEEQRTAVKAEEQQRTSRLRKARQASQRLNMTLQPEALAREDAAPTLERLDQLLSELKEEANQEGQL